jgi:hypothetical protein
MVWEIFWWRIEKVVVLYMRLVVALKLRNIILK